MKKPILKNLKIDAGETRAIRAGMRKANNVKITINIDGDTLNQLRELAAETGVPYQRMVNRILKEGLGKDNSTESRLSKIEKELERLKKKLAA